MPIHVKIEENYPFNLNLIAPIGMIGFTVGTLLLGKIAYPWTLFACAGFLVGIVGLYCFKRLDAKSRFLDILQDNLKSLHDSRYTPEDIAEETRLAWNHSGEAWVEKVIL